MKDDDEPSPPRPRSRTRPNRPTARPRNPAPATGSAIPLSHPGEIAMQMRSPSVGTGRDGRSATTPTAKYACRPGCERRAMARVVADQNLDRAHSVICCARPDLAASSTAGRRDLRQSLRQKPSAKPWVQRDCLCARSCRATVPWLSRGIRRSKRHVRHGPLPLHKRAGRGYTGQPAAVRASAYFFGLRSIVHLEPGAPVLA